MKITLVGFMGSGKSTVGKLLSERLGVPFLDLDELIVEREGMSIPEIFERKGESYFRAIERELLEEVLSGEASVILSVGGGLFTTEENVGLVNSLSTSIFLDADFEVLWNRISSDKNRPLVRRGKEKVREIFEKRLPFYGKAHLRVRTDLLSPEEAVEEIIEKLSLEGKASR